MSWEAAGWLVAAARGLESLARELRRVAREEGGVRR
jgi:hypothetical protein